MNTSNLRKTTFLLTTASILPHLFCCALPVVAAIIALGGTLGLGAVLATNPVYNFVDRYHTYLIIVAIFGVVISGVLNYIAYRVDCREAACTHGSCKPKKTRAFRIFLLSLFLLMIDIGWFVTEDRVLGLHHENSHAEEVHHEKGAAPAGNTQQEHGSDEKHGEHKR